MGKRGGHKGGRGGKGGDRRNKRDANDWGVQTPMDMNNEAFEEFYKAQDMLAEEEWTPFLDSLRTGLPTTFRVTGSRAHAETINDLIKTQYVPTMQSVEVDGQVYSPPREIGWYPGGLAWVIDAPKRVIRKSEPFKRFQRFLVGETEVGNLTRQEAVSMIPPLFLDVQPHHKCLDMCAAPGSKTSQIIEALNPHHTESTGLLIANDSDYKRTHMLVHQTGRMPSKGLIVTNHDASILPKIDLGDGSTLRFDRILADVPCSGDGTLRKNLEIWKKWTAADGNSLHSLQLRILLRGLDLLAPGGRLVYSTCSFNPSEDESVIAAALNIRKNISIVDVHDIHPGLKRRNGKVSWKVATQPRGDIVWHDNYEDYKARLDRGEEKQGVEKGKGLPRSLWPPSNAEELHLERSMRLFPHDQDTGGFFVCVLEKAANATNGAETPIIDEASAEEITLPEAEPSTENAAAEVADQVKVAPGKRELSPSNVQEAEQETKKAKTEKEPKKFKRDPNWREDGFSFVDPNHEEVESIVKWFKLKDTFPRENLVVRNDDGAPLRTMYLVNPMFKQILENNDYSRIRMVSAGVKAFVRQDSQSRMGISCKWRIPGEGVSEIMPHIGDGLVKEMGLEDMKVMLEDAYPPLDTFRPDIREWLEAQDIGNILIRIAAGESAGGNLPMALVLPIWRAKTSVSLLIDKREKSMLSLRTFGEDICKPAPPQLPRRDATGNVPAKQDGDDTPVVVGAEGSDIDGGVALDAEEAAIADQGL